MRGIEYETDFRTIRYLHAKYAMGLCNQIFERENGSTFYIIEDDELRNGMENTENSPSSPKTKDDVFKTDTELGMERLKQQLNNPQKIDLSQIPKR